MWSARLEFSTSTKIARRPLGRGGGGAGGRTRAAKARSGVAVRTAGRVGAGSAATGAGGGGFRRLAGLTDGFLTVLRVRVGRLVCAMGAEPSTSSQGGAPEIP